MNNYPSCIKIPVAQKIDVKEALAMNNELILLANRLFGEGNWSHAVTNQTLDFVESIMGKYVCGCATFVKIQVNETHHEDMGYCYTEDATKGVAIHCARAGSLTDAFKKALLCFGDSIEAEIQKLMKKFQNTAVHCINREDGPISIGSLQTELPKPSAQSTPYIQPRDIELKEKENVLKAKSLNNQEEEILKQGPLKRKSPNIEQSQPGSPVQLQKQPVKRPGTPKPGITSGRNSLIPLSPHSDGRVKQLEKQNKEQDENNELSELALLRMERKRRQMEKQAEYKKLMKQKEQQKLGEHKKPNPKY